MNPSKGLLPEWTSRILKVIRKLGLNQSEFAARVSYSAMPLSRWEHGSYEPTTLAYIQMGNLASEPDASWFWTRAGFYPTLASWERIATHLPSRFTKTSIHTYLPLESCPLDMLFSVSLPWTTATLPNTFTFMGPNS